MSVVKKQLTKLIAAYPAAKVNDEMLETWTKRMGRYTPSIVTKTVDTLIDTCRFFPSVAQFAECAEAERSKEKQVQTARTRGECHECEGGWVYIDTPTEAVYANGTPKIDTTTKPCRTCLPEPYERWTAGEYKPRMVSEDEDRAWWDRNLEHVRAIRTALEALEVTQ
tara:strand:- start:23 stop:523 length:501 start_codon:yes stop_codon:yes gene_type:complete